MDKLNLIIQLSVLAFLVEAVVNTLTQTFAEGKASVPKISAIVVGVIIALSTQLDIFEVIKVPNTIPMVGIILSGILISRGGNFVHELFEKIGSGE